MLKIIKEKFQKWTVDKAKKNVDARSYPVIDAMDVTPEDVKKAVAEASGSKGLPYTEKDIQSLMNNACGWYCLAFGHFINASKFRSNNLLNDASSFLEMFEDLNKSVDFKKNEYILKHFFRSEDPSLRKDIEVITEENTPGGIDAFKMPVDVKLM